MFYFLSPDMATNNYGFRFLDFRKTVDVLLSVGVLDQTPVLGYVHVKMSVLLIKPWCRRICFH